jgi:hypothetical protein
MIYRSAKELPRSLAGYALWLQVYTGGVWQVACQLRRRDARELLSWVDQQPEYRRRLVRVEGERL